MFVRLEYNTRVVRSALEDAFAELLSESRGETPTQGHRYHSKNAQALYEKELAFFKKRYKDYYAELRDEGPKSSEATAT